MQIVKTGLKGLKPSDLISKSEHVETSISGNANFPTPTPAIADVTVARVALVAALKAAESRATAAIVIKNEAVKTLSQLLTKLSRYVNSVAAGDVDKAVSSGFTLAKNPEPIDKLEAPSKLECRTGSLAGHVDSRWKGVRGARMYRVDICDGDPTKDGQWRQVGLTSRAKLSVSGLNTDQKYAFRVSALGAVGEGPASDVVTAKAA